MRISSTNPGARHFQTIYVDAFAGTGYRTRTQTPGIANLFEELTSPDTEKFKKGSARIALEVEPPFDQYLFIERGAELFSLAPYGSKNGKTEFPGDD